MTRRIRRRPWRQARTESGKRTKTFVRGRLGVVEIQGFDTSDPLCTWVQRAFGGTVPRNRAMPRSPETAVAAVLLERIEVPSSPGRNVSARTTARPGSKVPSIQVSWVHGEMIVGPLLLPDRAGCGYCAFERRRAVREGIEGPSGGGEEGFSDASFAEAVGLLLVKEIRTVLRKGWRKSMLVDHAWVMRAAEGALTRHRVVPLPHCPGCGGAAAHRPDRIRLGKGAAGRRGVANSKIAIHAEQTPEVLLSTLNGWVDPILGVISRLHVEDPVERGLPLPWVATAAPPFLADSSGALRRFPLGWGKGLTMSGALLSAVGEAIERYAPSLPDPARIQWRRLRELEGEVLDPRHGPLYTEAQYRRPGFPFARFDPDLVHPWVEGRWLDTGHRVWVPAIFAYLSLDLGAGQLFCQGTSNGLAATTNAEDGQLRATLELVERDAFMAAWLTGSPCPRLDLDETLDSGLGEILEGIAALGGKVEVRVLPTSACGTAIACLAMGDGRHYPGITLGLGADLDPELALKQAILELGQTGPHLRRLMQTGAVPVPKRKSDVREMLDHAAYYFRPDRVQAFEAMRSSSKRVGLKDLRVGYRERSLGKCSSTLSESRIRVALVDVTSADVATGPFQVWRAVSPDLQPISYGFGMARQRSRRLGRSRSGSRPDSIHPIW